MSRLSLAQQQLAVAVINSSENSITCLDDVNALYLIRESGEVLISFQHSDVTDVCCASGSAKASAEEVAFVKAAGGAPSFVDAMNCLNECASSQAAGGGGGGGGGGGSAVVDDGSIRDNGGGGSEFAPSLSWVEDKWHMHCSSPFPAKDTMRRNAVLGYIKFPNGETLQVLHIVNAMSAQEKAAWQNENGFVSKYKHSLALALRIFSNWKHVDYLNKSARRAHRRAASRFTLRVYGQMRAATQANAVN